MFGDYSVRCFNQSPVEYSNDLIYQVFLFLFSIFVTNIKFYGILTKQLTCLNQLLPFVFLVNFSQASQSGENQNHLKL